MDAYLFHRFTSQFVELCLGCTHLAEPFEIVDACSRFRVTYCIFWPDEIQCSVVQIHLGYDTALQTELIKRIDRLL